MFRLVTLLILSLSRLPYTLFASSSQGITTKESVKLILSILKQVMEEKLNAGNVEIARISVDNETKEPVYRMYEKSEIETVLKDLTN